MAGLAASDELGQALRPDPARDALAARLAGAEPRQHADELDEVGPVVDDDDGARAEVGAGPAQRIERIGRVECVGWQEATGWPADEDGLRLATLRQRPAEADDIPQRGAERHLRD